MMRSNVATCRVSNSASNSDSRRLILSSRPKKTGAGRGEYARTRPLVVSRTSTSARRLFLKRPYRAWGRAFPFRKTIVVGLPVGMT